MIKLKDLLLEAKTEVGDKDFPLWIDKKNDIDRKHKLVGKKAEINRHGKEVFSDKHGEDVVITGVIIKDDQIAGYEVKSSGKRYWAPKKDYYIEGELQLLEDVYLHSEATMMVREKLKHFQTQHDYMGREWDGVEMICYKLAELTKAIAIESVGWYKYPSSTRHDQDGKDWRYVCTLPKIPVLINCHSLLHDNVWTLSTTIYDSKQIDKNSLKSIGNDDVWKRSMLWAIKTAEVLQTDGFDYSEPIQDFKKRMSIVDDLYGMKQKVELEIKEAYQKIFKEEAKIPKKISIGLNSWDVLNGKIAVYKNPDSLKLPYGTITIKPKAVKDKEYLRFIIMHELIHAAFGQRCNKNGSHHKKFQKLATVLGLPEKYQD